MTNVECRMTKQEPAQKRPHPGFAINSSFVIWFSSFPFYLIPNLIQLSQIGIPKPLALGVQLVLEPIESHDKLVGSGLQRAFGIEFAFAREIDDREQQIADLVLNCLLILRSDCVLHFIKFFSNLRDHVTHISPIEIDARNF